MKNLVSQFFSLRILEHMLNPLLPSFLSNHKRRLFYIHQRHFIKSGNVLRWLRSNQVIKKQHQLRLQKFLLVILRAHFEFQCFKKHSYIS